MADSARDAPPALVLINPAAAGGRALRIATALEQWLRRHAPQAVLHVPASAAASDQLLQSAPCGSRVVLVGGDGTVHQALPALLERRHVLGLVPLGSGNDTARALGLHHTPWPRALARALVGPATPMDLGLCSAEGQRWPFISSLAGGFDAAVGLRALRGPRWLRGMPRYLWATLNELSRLRCQRMRVQVDSQPWHEGPCVFVSALNTASYGGGMPAAPHASPHDGHLDAVIAGDLGRLATAALLPRLLVGRHLSHPRVHTRRFQSLTVETEAPVALAGDGEALTVSTRWHIQSLARALQVVQADSIGTTIPTS